MSKIPLTVRKAIKEALAKAEASVRTASETLGTTLQLVDNTAELYEKLGDHAANVATGYVLYYEAFAKAALELTTHPLQKEALRDRLGSVGGRVYIELTANDAPDSYFVFKDDGLAIHAKPNGYGSWISYYNAQQLEKVLTSDVGGVQIPLAARRVLQEAEAKIEVEMRKVSDAYGSVVEWDKDQIPQVWQWLHQHAKADDNFGNVLLSYVVQFAKVFIEFNKNADNKEAVQEALRSGRVRFKLEENEAPERYWVWEEGNLCMSIKPNSWGSWISYYNGEHLEKTL